MSTNCTQLLLLNCQFTFNENCLHFNVSTVFNTCHFITLYIFCTFLSTVQLERFVESDYHRLALQKLEACPLAMESLGAPPLKVHNIHLTNRNNRVDQHTAQVLCFRKSSECVILCSTGAFTRLFLQNFCPLVLETRSAVQTIVWLPVPVVVIHCLIVMKMG